MKRKTEEVFKKPSKRRVIERGEDTSLSNQKAILFSKDRDLKLSDFYKKLLDFKIFSSDPVEFPKIPSEFKDITEYENSFQPILFAELEAQIKNSLEKTNIQPSEFNWMETNSRQVHSFYTIELESHNCKEEYIENFVLIAKSKDYNKKDPNSYMTGIIRLSDTNQYNYDDNDDDYNGNVTISVIIDIEKWKIFRKGIDKSTILYVYKSEQLSSTIREYLSIKSVHLFPLLNQLLRYEAGLPATKRLTVAPKYNEYISNSFNESQYNSIMNCSMTRGFHLIQGPPGTGKTKTLLGLINTLHIHQYQIYNDRLVEHYADFPEIYDPSKDISKDNENNNNTNNSSNNSGYLSLIASSMRNIHKTSKIPPKPRMLVTAPSNSAVDEIIRRLIDIKFRDGTGTQYNPNIVRIGVGASRDIESVTLNMISKSYDIDPNRKQSFIGDRLAKIQNNQKRIYELKGEIKLKKNTIINGRKFTKEVKTEVLSNPEFCRNIGTLLHHIEENDRLQSEVNYVNNGKESRDVDILEKADIIFTTLSSSGLSILDNLELNNRQIETVIIDEAAQSTELQTLIPLRFGCAHCVLVGDHNQLPATIVSKAAINSNYQRSLFERLIDLKYKLNFLDTQYRSNPEIMKFPSDFFYKGKLKSHSGLQYSRVLECHKMPIFGPFNYFNVVYGREDSKDKSFANRNEAEFVILLIEKLKFCYPNLPIQKRIGIISPYKGQVNLIQELINQKFPYDSIEVNTVDGYQGREKDFIILTTVRANKQRNLGFLDDLRRMNVSITRAKYCFWIVGNSGTLNSNEAWRELITYSHKNHHFYHYYTVEDVYNTFDREINYAVNQNKKPKVEYLIQNGSARY